MKNWLGTFLVAAAGAAVGYGAMHLSMPDTASTTDFNEPKRIQVVSAAYDQVQGSLPLEAPDFVHASNIATPAVVHIKSTYPEADRRDPSGGLFGMPHPGLHPQSSGSGVIISQDGYIATNNHVVRKAEKVEVVLEDKRAYEAEVIGLDPTTDLALLKIDATGLPFLPFTNSDKVQVGEWVMAVGNPFNLTSTVTAGIVSAKGRSLNLLNEDFAIESFIQTDAAVNPGNSGGALINTQGQLIGINTAIASETGSFAGYSFAVPANIVRKVMEDLMEYGEVQRGIIGVQIRNINAQFAQAQGLSTLNGAFISGTIEGGAANAAGIKAGDVITKVNETPIRSASELQGTIGTYRPGEHVNIEVVRGDETLYFDVTLRDREGRTTLSSKQRHESDDALAPAGTSSLLGAKLAPISLKEKQALGIEGGVKLAQVGPGKLKEAGMEDGFIVTRVNKQYVSRPEDLARHLRTDDGTVLVEGLTPDGTRKSFAFEQ